MQARRLFTHALFASAFALGVGVAQAEDAPFPSKPIRIIVGYTAGGGTDILARVVGQKLSTELGQPVIVENRPGAGTNIAATLVARAPADGYTLFLSASALAINGSLYKKLDYDPIKSFSPVALFGQSPNVMAVPYSLGVSTVAEFISYAKKQGAGVNFSSAGGGSSQHLASEMFRQQAGIDAKHIPYKGSAPSITAVMSGEVQYTFANVPAIAPMMKGDRLRVLAISSAKRSSALPDVPTMAEAGLPNMLVAAWYGVLAPANTPAAIVNTLNQAINKSVADPAFREQLEKQGVETISQTPAYFAQFLAEDIKRWAPVIKAGNVQSD